MRRPCCLDLVHLDFTASVTQAWHVVFHHEFKGGIGRWPSAMLLCILVRNPLLLNLCINLFPPGLTWGARMVRQGCGFKSNGRLPRVNFCILSCNRNAGNKTIGNRRLMSMNSPKSIRPSSLLGTHMEGHELDGYERLARGLHSHIKHRQR